MIDKIKRNVNEKDYTRLGLVESDVEINENNIKGFKKSNIRKTVHVGVLDKIKGIVVKGNDNESTRLREIALRVWSKKSRNLRADGLSVQMVNKGKMKQDRGIVFQKEKSVTGVYTRICWKNRNGRSAVYKWISQQNRDENGSECKRRGRGRKVDEMKGKRMWLNNQYRDQTQKRKMIEVLVRTSKENTNITNQIQNIYTLTMLKGLMMQRLSMSMMRVSRETMQKK